MEGKEEASQSQSNPTYLRFSCLWGQKALLKGETLTSEAQEKGAPQEQQTAALEAENAVLREQLAFAKEEERRGGDA